MKLVEDAKGHRYPGLDGFRAFAMSLVFLHHYNPLPSSHLARTLCLQGYSGVQFFFVLSGFLITGILWDARNQPNRFSNFYIRRVFRIFPVYYALWLILLLLYPLAHWDWNWRWLFYLVHLGNYNRFLFLHPSDLAWLDTLQAKPGFIHAAYLGHLWSLCIEEQFYLIWPAVVFACRRREQLRNVCISIIIATPLLRVLLTYVAPPGLLRAELLYRSMPTQIDALVWGALLAMLVRGPEVHFLHRHNGRLFLISLATAGAYWAGTYLLYPGQFPGTNIPYVTNVGFLVYSVLATGLLLRTIHPGSEVCRLLSNRWIAKFGVVTYAFYLFHDPPHRFYADISHRLLAGPHEPLRTALIALTSTTVIALLSFHYFEKPILRWRDTFTKRQQARFAG